MTDKITIGSTTFDPDLHTLQCGDRGVTLEPRVSRLLRFLIGRAGRLARPDELIEHVWEGRVVSDDAIRQSVSKLRSALLTCEAALELETIPRTGYVLRTLAELSVPMASSVSVRSAVGGPSIGPVELTASQRAFVDEILAAGNYATEDELVRDALRLLERRIRKQQARLEAYSDALSKNKRLAAKKRDEE